MIKNISYYLTTITRIIIVLPLDQVLHLPTLLHPPLQHLLNLVFFVTHVDILDLKMLVKTENILLVAQVKFGNVFQWIMSSKIILHIMVIRIIHLKIQNNLPLHVAGGKYRYFHCVQCESLLKISLFSVVKF